MLYSTKCLYVSLFAILSISAMSIGSVFALADDQLCYGVNEGIVFVDNKTDQFVQCFNGYVLQPVGGALLHDATRGQITDIDRGQKKEIPENEWIAPVGYSSMYGYVYIQQKIEGSIASYDEDVTMAKRTQQIALVVLLLLALYGLYLLLSKKEQE